MGFDRRHHGGPGHSEADDTYPNCGIRLFGHCLLLLLAMTVLKQATIRLSAFYGQAFRWADDTLTLSHQGHTPGIT
jgi:hypothetical protein